MAVIAPRLPLLGLVFVLSGCGLPGANDVDTDCPETWEADGEVNGIDLAAPDWLPDGFPLPEGISLRHINRDQLGMMRVLTGFIPDGDAETVVAALSADLADAGYETIFAADGFVPVSWEALVVADDEGVVIVDVAHEELPVRNDEGDCPWESGLIVGLRFDAPEVRAHYVDASLTRGSARAVIAGGEYFGDGECFVRPGDDYTFGSFSPLSGAGMSVQLRVTDGVAGGFASVDGEEVVFALDVTPVSGVEPVFRVTASGFTVEGMFIDATGDLGMVGGRVEVTCD